jgi:kynurenine formamidase
MKVQTFVVGCVLALALLLFGQRHPSNGAVQPFHSAVDLTHSINASVPTYELSERGAYQVKTVATLAKDKYFARNFSMPEHYGTHLDAPAHFARGTWTVDQIPLERLVAPLVVLDVTIQAKQDPDYRVGVADIAKWEQVNGQIPPGTIVIARTGWEARWSSSKEYRNADSRGVMHFPGFSLDAAKFLVEGRNVIALGIDTLSIDYGPSKDFEVHQYTLTHSLYQLENVANLESVPETGAMLIAAPMKLEGGSGAPVRILAMLK